MEFDEARSILEALDREQVRYVLVDSMAMAAQGLGPRHARHGPLRRSRQRQRGESEAGVAAGVRGRPPDIDEISAADLGGAYPAIEYSPPHGKYSLDILARLGEAFAYQDIEAEERFVGGTRVRVATPRMLFRMKKDTVRPQDRVDAAALRERFSLMEELMGVRKFRDAAAMPGPSPRSPDDPDNLRLACEWSRLALELAGLRRRPGLRRFRSHAELVAAKANEGRRAESPAPSSS